LSDLVDADSDCLEMLDARNLFAVLPTLFDGGVSEAALHEVELASLLDELVEGVPVFDLWHLLGDHRDAGQFTGDARGLRLGQRVDDVLLERLLFSLNGVNDLLLLQALLTQFVELVSAGA